MELSRSICTGLVSVVLLAPICCANDKPQARAAAHIDLYNPVDWHGPVVVEIPVGQIAAPQLIDWQNVRLLRKDEEIPFAIRIRSTGSTSPRSCARSWKRMPSAAS